MMTLTGAIIRASVNLQTTLLTRRFLAAVDEGPSVGCNGDVPLMFYTSVCAAVVYRFVRRASERKTLECPFTTYLRTKSCGNDGCKLSQERTGSRVRIQIIRPYAASIFWKVTFARTRRGACSSKVQCPVFFLTIRPT